MTKEKKPGGFVRHHFRLTNLGSAYLERMANERGLDMTAFIESTLRNMAKDLGLDAKAVEVEIQRIVANQEKKKTNG